MCAEAGQRTVRAWIPRCTRGEDLKARGTIPGRRPVARTAAAVLALAVAAGCGGGAQKTTAGTVAQASRPGAGAAGSSFASLTKDLQRALDSARANLSLPGVAAAVVVPGQGAWTGVSGKASIATGEPVQPRTLFAVGSVTKTFVAAIVVKLAEEGRLSLDDRLERWVHGFPNGDRITIRQLLEHRAGTQDFFEIPAFERAIRRFVDRHGTRGRWPARRTLSFVRRPYAEPGATFHYSNTDYILLGSVIAAATHTSVAVQLHRLLDPLHLREVVLQPDERPRGPKARGYNDVDNDGHFEAVPADPDYIPTTFDATAAWTAGGLAASARGLAAAADALFRGRMLPSAGLGQMTRFIDADLRPPFEAYGLGVARQRYRGIELWGHPGDVFGFQAEMWYLPKVRTTVVTVTNWHPPEHDTLYRDALLDVLRKHFGL